jgi:hypothetical protein
VAIRPRPYRRTSLGWPLTADQVAGVNDELDKIYKELDRLSRRVIGADDGTIVSPHKLLSLSHSDTTPADPVTGDLLVAQSSLWSRLAIGAASRVLTVSGGVPAWALLVNANIDPAAAIAWTKIDKTGSSLADLATRSASDLSSGTLPDGRFPATLPAISGANLTNLDASDLASGTVPDARLSANVARRDQNNTFDAGSGASTLTVQSSTGNAALTAATSNAANSAQFAAQSQNGSVLSFGRDNSGASISMGTGDAYLEIIGPSSQGLLANWYRFPATQVPSSNVNTLDDYEEGTWTPVIGGAGGTSGQAYSAQTGTYIRIGRLVIVFFRVALSTLGTITGNAEIQGLPFTSSADVQVRPGIVNWANMTTALILCQTALGVSVTAAALRASTAATTNFTTSLVQADLSNTTVLNGSIAYLTDS